VSHHEVKQRFPKEYEQWVKAPQQVRFAGGESLDDVKRRAMVAIEQIAGRHAGQNVVAVSHRVVNKVLLCALLGLDNSHFWSLHQDTCAINVVEKDALHGWIIRTLNDTSHIQPLASWFSKNKKTADF
jgi:probable phosphoglycerate mutase